jgi:hypothetical protein
MGKKIDANGYCLGVVGTRKVVACNRLRFGGNIKVFLKEMGMEGVDYIHLAEDRENRQAVVKDVPILSLRVAYNAGNLLRTRYLLKDSTPWSFIAL